MPMGRAARAGLASIRFATSVLPVLAFFLTVAGLVLRGVTYEPRLAQHVLLRYSRYQQAERALQILQERKYPMKDSREVGFQVGVLDITDPAWSVMLDFLQSEIAIRKSERNEPGPQMFTPPTTPGASEAPKAVELPPIDFHRLKTIISVEIPTIRAGTKPLVGPNRLIVLFPNTVFRRVYEFLSFTEFQLDLRLMLVQEVRFGSIVFAGVALLVTALTALSRWVLGCFAPQLLEKPAIARSTPTTGNDLAEPRSNSGMKA